MKPIRLMFCILLAVTAWQRPAAAQARPLPRRPNIILIVADGLAAHDLSCYGQTQFQTPNLDKLAAGGIRFTHYSAGTAESSAAGADLMLGVNNAPTNTDVTLGPGDVTIAQLLKNSGYWTCLIGGWHLGDASSSGAPWRQGFDEFAGYFTAADIANPYADFIWRYEPGNAKAGTPGFNGSEMISANSGGQQGGYIPDWLATLSNTFIKKHRPFWFNHYQPFFLELNCPLPGNGDRVVPSDAPYSEESWPQAEKDRAAMISRLDGYIGQLLQQLDKVNETSNTVIFFTSDTIPKKSHGLDPKFFQESSSPDSLRVPMMASWPGKIPAGQVSDRDCSARDLLPTVADVGLVTPPKEIDGVPFLNAWPTPASTQPPNASGLAH